MMNIIFGMAQHSLQNAKSKNIWVVQRVCRYTLYPIHVCVDRKDIFCIA